MFIRTTAAAATATITVWLLCQTSTNCERISGWHLDADQRQFFIPFTKPNFVKYNS